MPPSASPPTCWRSSYRSSWRWRSSDPRRPSWRWSPKSTAAPSPPSARAPLACQAGTAAWERDDRPVVERCVALWERVLDAVESGDHDAIAADIDWAAKLRLIRQVQDRTGADLDHPRLAQIDLTYHDIRPGRGLHSVLERRGLVSRVVDDPEIDRARHSAPETTRAALRGRFISAAAGAGRDYTVDWVHLKVADGTLPTVALTDPFAAEDPRVDDLIAALGR
ncbi:MAG: proteasome accessory factor PafA2 family protein [Dietzia cercidiphylli]